MSNNNSVNLRNVREITANSINLLTDDNLVENIYDIFSRLQQIIKAKTKTDPYSGKVSYLFEPSDINDQNIPGLKSMIDYFETNYKTKHNTYLFEDNHSIVVKKQHTNKSNHFFNDDNSITTIKKQYKQNVHHNIVQNECLTFNKINKKQTIANIFNHSDSHVFNRTNNNTHQYNHLTTTEDFHFHRNQYNNSHHNAIFQTDNFTTSKYVKNYKQVPIVINQENHFWFSRK